MKALKGRHETETLKGHYKETLKGRHYTEDIKKGYTKGRHEK